jgi:hypothetical protein
MIGKRQEKLAIIQSLASVQSTVLLSNPQICFQSAVISPSQTNSPAAPQRQNSALPVVNKHGA